MPLYNSEAYVEQAILSVMKQTYTNWELVITDDCSCDNSCDIVGKFLHDHRIHLHRLSKNSGPGVARNSSIFYATGDVIAFLDSDDLWDSCFLEKSLLFMENVGASIVFSSYRRCSEDLAINYGEFIVPKRVDYADLLKSCSISCLTGMYNVDRSMGKVFMPDIAKRQDYCMWLELLKRVKYAYGIQECMATYRIRNNSISRNKFQAASYQWYVYKKIEKLSTLCALYNFCQYALRGIIKNFSILKK